MKFLAAVSLCIGLAAAGSRGKKIKNIVAFGDSYTDEGRLNYFGGNNGKAPPPGYVFPPSNTTASGGKVWARMAGEAIGAKVYNYAVSGAVCSNELTPRTFGTINAPFPSVREYEIPAFAQDRKYLKLDLSETVFAIWIGTNDIGANALLTHEQLPNVGLTNVTTCIYKAVEDMKKLGAQNIVVLNMAPLELAPIYADAAHGGFTHDSVFWLTKSEATNITEVAEEMRELTRNANEILKYKIPAETASWKRTNVGSLDAHSILWDIYHKPSKYLTGPKPLNVSGYNNKCTLSWQCTLERPDAKDSYFWFDELHPSEVVEKIVGEEFVKLLKGRSKYGKWY